ncbi:methyltransferase domain-containing protein [Calothrix sp. NIES-3974]|uniref:methyltransferase domain-containing protein n=1 Tax=Calothrix sp. NIES-3974 TaxID=2005462 RepID=UPI000B5EE857|nr:methyltransferase domain-containing protein [Calothrix sp. NIES-3974]BAZ04642.1 thiol methyltransferase 1-like protein [Calothrix sp. NIES-3974]
MLDSKDWNQRYLEGKTGWDIGQAAPPFTSLLQSDQRPAPGKVAVLGCGRGYDALLFAEFGFEVIGFDFAETAIESAVHLAQTHQNQAQFQQRDIFDLPGEFSNYFDYVVEHTCFCAILPPQRGEYVKVVKSILKPQGKLIGLFFTHNRPGGPPFGSTPAEIQTLFTIDFRILSFEPVTNSIPQRRGEEHLGIFQRLD